MQQQLHAGQLSAQTVAFVEHKDANSVACPFGVELGDGMGGDLPVPIITVEIGGKPMPGGDTGLDKPATRCGGASRRLRHFRQLIHSLFCPHHDLTQSGWRLQLEWGRIWQMANMGEMDRIYGARPTVPLLHYGQATRLRGGNYAGMEIY